ncbi:CPNA2-like protein [Mya arenaria]|uniref:CPNA2-like protein n=1 Tax=Mya arenaria TaxID=6604 RepID=A0ABY7F5G9_MYAAR|nr:CPNA2-like protein [Mya arenaria]
MRLNLDTNHCRLDLDSMASRKFRAYADRFSTLTEVAEAIREEGLGKCGLIFGIDYTMSNKVQGEKTFHGKSLHEICEDRLNPYQEVIKILGQTLEYFDDDNYIPSYGFGDITTKDQGIFALKKGEVLDAYNRITPSVKLHRPTNFAPLIYKAISIVQATKKFDDRLPTRNFDNFQFVDFAEVMSSSSHPAAAFALACLMEIPDQYRAIRQLGYLEED